MATLQDKNGLGISLDQTYGSTIYTSLGWNVSAWNFSPSALPLPILPSPNVYNRTEPISYTEIDKLEIIKNGTFKTLFEFNGSTLYSGFQPNLWYFYTDSNPLPNLPPSAIYENTPIDYSPWVVIERLLQGIAIPIKNASNLTTYTSLGWNIPGIWDIKESMLMPEPVLPSGPSYDRDAPIEFDEIILLEALKNGNNLKNDLSLLRSTYEKVSWDFTKSWGIREHLGLPRPLKVKKHTPNSDPMSSTAWEVLLKPDEDGTLFYKDDIWVAEDNPRRIYTDGGYINDTIQHVMYNEVVKFAEGVYYVFMGSGVEDATHPSGYTIPQAGVKQQLVSIKEKSSSDVAFYYTRVSVPDYDQLIKVATENPDVAYHLIATSKRPQSIKLRLPNRQYAYLPLVPLDDPFSSPVKVKTSNGVMAIQSSEINESLFNIIEDDKSKLSVLYVTKDIHSNDSVELIAELKRLGHRIIIIGDDTIVNKSYDGFEQYDLIVIGRTTTSAYSNIINLSRKPVILGYAVESAKNLQLELDFASNPYHTETTFNPTQTVINNTHPIMLPFAKNQTFNAYKATGNQFIGVLDGQNGTINGVPLIKVSNHTLNPAYSMTAYENISGYRRVYMGFLYKDFSDTTKILLERSIRWVMKQDSYLYK